MQEFHCNHSISLTMFNQFATSNCCRWPKQHLLQWLLCSRDLNSWNKVSIVLLISDKWYSYYEDAIRKTLYVKNIISNDLTHTSRNCWQGTNLLSCCFILSHSHCHSLPFLLLIVSLSLTTVSLAHSLTLFLCSIVDSLSFTPLPHYFSLFPLYLKLS